MAVEFDSPAADGITGSGDSASTTGRSPGVGWVVVWTLLLATAIPAALMLSNPLAALLFWLSDLGSNAGLWPAVEANFMRPVGFGIALALFVAAIQAVMLQRYLLHPGQWFAATAVGLLAGGLVAGAAGLLISRDYGNPFWLAVSIFLPLGLPLGVAQWLTLRRYVPNAGWIILLDVLATGSVLVAGSSYTNLLEVMVVLFLPGLISGAGVGVLLRQAHPALRVIPRTVVESRRKRPRLVWLVAGLAALVPLFFAGLWVYAVSTLALAKDEGIYPTVEEAIIGKNSQGWGGAKVVRIDNIHASTNNFDGSMPHVWFGGATIYLDRAPRGYDWTQYPSGSFYLHVRDGWVYVPEGAFPELVGWAMQLYGLEGVER